MIRRAHRFTHRRHLLSTCARLILTLALLGSLSLVAWAQAAAARPNRGVAATNSYAISDIERVNLTNGNLNLSIPLSSLPPTAGGDLGLTLSANYNSKMWDTARNELQPDPLSIDSRYAISQLQLSGGGWNIDARYFITFEDASFDYAWLPPAQNDPEYELLTLNRWSKVVLYTPDGATHELRPKDYSCYSDFFSRHPYLRGYYKDDPNTANASLRYYSFDGSYFWVKIDPSPLLYSGIVTSWTLYTPDGTKVEQSAGIQRITDTNGNKIKIWGETDGAGVSTTHYQDELTGREIKYVYNPAGNGGQGQGQVQYQTVGGAWMAITVNYGTTRVFGKTYWINDALCTDAADYVDETITVIRSIVFPQTEPGLPARQFTFNYNSDTVVGQNQQWRPDCNPSYITFTSASNGWGSLSQVGMPSGATVNYAYDFDGLHALTNPDDAPRESLVTKTVTHDGTTDTWTYGNSPGGGGVTNPDGSQIVETMYPYDRAFAHNYAGFGGKEGLVYRSDNSGKTRVERHWTLLDFGGDTFAPGPGVVVTFNPVVDAEYTSLMEGGAPVKMSAKTFQYDFNGNLLQETQYDWFDPALVSRDAQGVPTGVPPGAVALRVINHSYYNQATTSNSPNVYARRDPATAMPRILNALQQSITGPSQTQFSYDGQAYGSPPTSGNLTKESRWDNINSQWLNMIYAYDSYGNKTSATDPNGNVTRYFFEDATHANQTKVVVNPGTSPATEQATTMVNDYSTGALLSRTDPNGKTTETDYTNQLLGTPDPFLRPGVVTGPPVNSYVNGVTNANQRHKVKTTYKDDARQVIAESDLNTSGDYKLKTRTTTDQLGRTILTEKNEDGASNYTISNQAVYVQMGKITLASNPRRSGAATSDGWVRTTRDNLGRVVEVATFSNAAQPPATGANANWTGSVTTTYNANETTVKDQANKERRSVADALGRLARVIENPNGAPSYTTDYTYDQLGNLRKAVQGSQTRFFLFDSLSRLIRTRNPEQEVNTSLSPITDPVTNNSQWSISFNYYANGNLQSKTNARNITTGYTYDRMNRNLTVDYSDTAVIPDITRVYDTAPVNGMGRLHKAYAGGDETNGTQVERYEISDYDSTGRPLKIHQSFKTGGGAWSGAYSTERKCDLAGNPTWQQYPSGRTVDWVYDNDGRLNTFKGTLGGTSRDYVLGTTYNAAGGRTREQFGTSTNVYHHLSYTSRGHLYDVRVGTGAVNDGSNPSWNRGALRIYYSSNWAYGNGGADNNGNVYRMDHFIPLDVNVSQWTMSSDYYGYDAFNRISSVAENKSSNGQGEQSVFRQDYVYDRWGNQTIGFSDVPGAFNLPFNVDAATNRLMAPNGSISYDKDGNQTNDGYSGGGSRSYDAENRMTAAQGHAYAYDPDGRRVRRAISGGQTYWQVFGVAGELVAEYAAGAQPATPLKEYGYRGGQILIVAESGSGGSASLVKPAFKSGVDIGKKTDRAVKGNAHGPSVVDEPFADLEFNEDSGSKTTDLSGDNDTGALIDDKADETTEGEHGDALSSNGIGGALLAGHLAGAQPTAPQKEYSRGSRSLVAAQGGGIVTVTPGACQTPVNSGDYPVNSPTNTGYGETYSISSANAPGGFFNLSDSAVRSAKWSAFPSVSGTIVSIRLKFNWSIGGIASASADGNGGSASSSWGAGIEYSLNGGSSWIGRVVKGLSASGNDFQILSDSGSEDILLSAGQNITQIQIRTDMSTFADATGGEFLGSSSQANITTSISNIRLEVQLDTTAPVISNVAAGGITATNATITWNTNENSDSQVEYGTTTAYGQSTALNPALVTAHSQGLSGLTSGTLYHYRVKSKDAAGNLAVSGDFTFTTPDITAPVISSVAAGSITATNATITWNTNENSDSQVEYGTTTAYGQSTALNPALVTAHSQGLSGLTSGTLYHYRVKSKDAAGNLAVSGDFTFTTAPDTTPPTVTSFSPAAGATNVNANANVTVTFSEAMNPATVNGSTVELRDPSNALAPATVSYNSASLTATLDPTGSLAAGVTYTARIRGGGADPRVKDVAGNPLAADLTWTFTTAQSGSGGIKWLVTDHLGSTRIVIDETGSLEGIKRHDFLPFGQELSAGVGIRNEGNGYGADSVRQKFTSKQHDLETGLDYFEARYYAGKQGRFTSPDEFSGGPDDLFDFADAASENPTLYAELTEPQSLNKYQYCYNNPLSFTDIDGHKSWGEWLSTGLEVASYIPGPIGTAASVVQAGVALAQGDYKGAALAAMGAIPGGKLIAKAGKVIDKVADGVKLLKSGLKGGDDLIRVVATGKGGKIAQSQFKLRDGEKGLSVFKRVDNPGPSEVVDAVRAAGKKGDLAAANMKVSDVKSLGLRVVKTKGGTPNSAVNDIHYEIRLPRIKSATLRLKGASQQEYFNEHISPKLAEFGKMH